MGRHYSKSDIMGFKQLSDFELMDEIREGNQQAFTALVRKYQQSLYCFFWFMGVSAVESEDLVQEVFLRLFAYRHQYQPKAKLKTFLYILARRIWIDRLRKARRHEENSLPVEISDPADYCLDLERQIDVQNALGKLSEKLRSVVVMTMYQDLKYKEIAEVLNIPEGTVKSRMHLALRQLKEILSDQTCGPKPPR